MSRLKRLVLHPLIFSVYPVLALLAHNLGESRLSVGVRPSIVSIVGAAFVLLITYLWLKDWRRSAILATFAIVIFFSYGHVYHYLEQYQVLGINIGRHRILLPILAILFIIGIWWIVKRLSNLQLVTEVLNIIALAALIFPIVQISIFQIQTSQLMGEKPVSSTGTTELQDYTNQPLPDIYYIVMDAYARADSLQEFYGYDNTAFLDQLDELGFFVADCSQSNYAKTRLSLVTSLNMNYLDAFEEIQDDLKKQKENRIRMWRLIHRNLVKRTLDDMGYTIVAFETGYMATEWDDADIYLSQNSGSLIDDMQAFSRINGFEALLIQTTVGLALLDAETIFSPFIAPAVVISPKKAHYDLVLYTLDTLESAPEIEGPKFVFAHIVSPHGPYVFTPTGEFVPDDEESGIVYSDQVTYLNTRLLPLLQKLIDESKTPPIIILQSDHGGHGTQFDSSHRMNILNAYYLPNGGDQYLYETISPVNSFRLIFDYYFGYEYDLLEDVSYYSDIENFFDFDIIPNLCDAD